MHRYSYTTLNNIIKVNIQQARMATRTVKIVLSQNKFPPKLIK